MRFVDGRDLKSLLEGEGTLPADRALQILTPIADALDSASPETRPPRREAGERAPRPRWTRVPDRLRHHQAGRRPVDGYRPGCGDARLPGPRTDPRRPRGRTDGLLCAGVRPLRVHGRRASLPQ